MSRLNLSHVEAIMMHKETDMDNFVNYDTDNTLYIDGNDDPFGINDVMIKFVELLDERYDFYSEIETEKPLPIDFTTLTDKEMRELIKEAVVIVKFENEYMDWSCNKAKDSRFFS